MDSSNTESTIEESISTRFTRTVMGPRETKIVRSAPDEEKLLLG